MTNQEITNVAKEGKELFAKLLGEGKGFDHSFRTTDSLLAQLTGTQQEFRTARIICWL